MALFGADNPLEDKSTQVNISQQKLLTESIIIDASVISSSGCRLFLQDTNGNIIREFDLHSTVRYFDSQTFTIEDKVNGVKAFINNAQVTELNAGAFADFTALFTFIGGYITACPSGGGGGSQDLQSVLTVGNDGGGLEIVNILDPTTPQSASTKNYTDIQDASTLASAEAYADALVVGLWDDRGNYNASVNAYPSSGGSGTAGAILKGDIWTISVAGTLPTGQVVEVGDTVRALIDTPANLQANWAIGQNNIGYVPENQANKTNTVVGNESSITLYLSVKGYYDYLISLTWLTNTIFGTWIFGLTSKTTPVNADSIVISDSADSNKAKNVTFTNLKAFLKTYFDTIYEPIFSVLSIAKGGTNSSTTLSNNRVMQSSGGAIVEAAAITPARVLISDANGIPIHSTITSATLAYLDATSSIQTQINAKAIGIINCNPADTIAAATTSYWQPFSNAGDAAESSRIWYTNVAGIMKYLLIRTATSQPGTGSQVITIRHELANTSITLTIAAGSAAGTFTDYVNTHTIAQGDRISIQSVNNATVTAGAQVNQITFIIA